jgi:hypothetical protein
LNLFNTAEAASAGAQNSPTIPVIVRNTTSFYWQTVLAGAARSHAEISEAVHRVELDRL